jgi:hypothetical protein
MTSLIVNRFRFEGSAFTVQGYLNPNPDKPELNIDDLRLKICGIASLCLFY